MLNSNLLQFNRRNAKFLSAKRAFVAKWLWLLLGAVLIGRSGYNKPKKMLMDGHARRK
jgi:hypothetical protein